MEENFKINEEKIDALKEVASIGSEHAATVLSEILNTSIGMKVPAVKILPFSAVPDTVGGPEQIGAGIYMEVTGQAPCNMLFLFPLESAFTLTDMMMEQSAGTTREIGAMEASALCEMVNVVGGAYLNSLAQFTKIDFIPSVPAIAVDMAGAILNTVLVHLSMAGDEALLLETEFAQTDIKVNGYVFLLPELGSLDKILQSIGVKS